MHLPPDQRWRRVNLAAAILFLLLPRIASATIYYVSPTGNDKNSGTSAASGFATPQRAINAATRPGDIVSIIPAPGKIYGGGFGITPPMVLVASGSGATAVPGGTCSKPITIEGYPLSTQRPVIAGVQGAINGGALVGYGANCIVVSGLELVGWNSNLTWPAVSANVAAGGIAWQNSSYTDYGIVFRGSDNGPAHHIIVNNLYVHDFPGGGIGFVYSDYISVLSNIVANNAQYSPSQGSGITLYQNKALDPSATTHNVISSNFVVGNISEVPTRNMAYTAAPALDTASGQSFLNVFTTKGVDYTQLVIDVPSGCIPPNTTVQYFGPSYIGLSNPTTCAIPSTDTIFYSYATGGTGIIVDNNADNLTAMGSAVYAARTLIIDNITTNNGGAGIECGPFSAHCDMIFNTSYFDQAGAYNVGSNNSPGAISVDRSYDINVYNNIVVAGPHVTLLRDASRAGVNFSNNLLFGGVAANFGFAIPGGGNVIGLNPLFVAPGTDPSSANFQLQPGSPAIGAGSTLFSRSTDYAGDAVTASSPSDIGAYEAP